MDVICFEPFITFFLISFMYIIDFYRGNLPNYFQIKILDERQLTVTVVKAIFWELCQQIAFKLDRIFFTLQFGMLCVIIITVQYG